MATDDQHAQPQAVRLHREAELGILVIDAPPVNALGLALRKGLYEGVVALEADPSVKAIVIRAEGRTFPAGADISEFGKPPVEPFLPDLCNRIEACKKPVIAAVHGTALGGGLEVALAAHYRLGDARAKFGLPEVTLGILPGAGGTQRTPRLIGAEKALSLMLSGKPILAAEALEIGLIDQIAEGDLAEAATRYAREILAQGLGPRPTREVTQGLRDNAAYGAAIAAARAKHAKDPLPGPLRIIDCVEGAALLPFPQGLGYERAAFQELVASPEAAGLRHAFFSERRAAKMPEAKVAPRALDHIAVIGGGFMGAGIAYACLSAGFTVSLMDRDEASLTKGLERIATLQEGAVQKGRLTAQKRAADWERLIGVTDLAGLAKADLVIEAVFEDFDVKAQLLKSLDGVLRPGAIMATNTSYLDVDALAAVTSRPQDVVGLHFFSPAHVMRLLELVVGAKTAPDVVATGLLLGKRLGKVAVRSGVCDGFIGNRILTAYRQVAEYLVEDGASPLQIDQAMRAFGMPLGPFEVSDMAGLQIAWARRKAKAATRDPALRYVPIADQLCEAGRFGQSTGKGWYLYEGRKPVEDPEVTALIAAVRADKGITPRSFSTQEIQTRLLVAMANEGAKILGEGIALRPSDIDVVKLFGYGFPRWQGGPMHWADGFGIKALQQAIADYAPQAPAFWHEAPILAELAKDGRSFADLNEG